MKKLSTSLIKSVLIIFLCFLLTSTGHLSWMYHLMEQTTAELSYFISTVLGYALQAVGIGVFMVLLRQKRVSPRAVFVVSLVVYAACFVPAVIGTDLIKTIIFGSLLSMFCGVIAGYYLYYLTRYAPDNHRAVSFSVGYSAATVVSWMISIIGDGAIYYSGGVIAACLALTVMIIVTVFVKTSNKKEEPEQKTTQPQIKLKTLLLMACGLVLLFSLVNNIGFSFSESEIQSGLHPEFSRVFYSVGLLTAGFVTDKNRKYGAVCALAALAIPFIVLALNGERISTTVFWTLGYLAFGFYSVYRVMLFSDIAKEHDMLWLSGAGLMIGRVGDALGSEIYAVFSNNKTILVVAAGVLFVGAVFLFIKLFQSLYITASDNPKSEQEIFARFAARHDLSGREREVLRLLLEEKTNKEISDLISVSESTVKFHVHNLLSKTGCKTRNDLKNYYYINRI